MSFPRIPGAGSTGLPPIHSPGGGSVTPGGGAKTQPGRPDDLSTRPMPATTQSTMAPRSKLLGGPAARASFKSAGPAHASPDHVAQEPTPAPAGPRTYEFYMNQFSVSGLRVDPPPAKGSADGAAQPEKPAAGSAPSSAAAGGGAKPGAPKAELPRNTFFTLDPPPSKLAASSGSKPEKPLAAAGQPAQTPVRPPPVDAGNYGYTLNELKALRAGQAGTTESASAGSAAKPEKPAAESAPSSAAAGGGAKPGAPKTELPLNTFFTVDPPPSKPAASNGSKPEKPPAAAGQPAQTHVLRPPVDAGNYEYTPNELNALRAGKTESASAGSAAKPEKPAAESAPSSAAAGGGAKPGAPKAELPLNTFFTVDPPSPPTPPAAPGGGGPDKPEKPPVQASVTIEPGGNQPHGAPESEADKMKKSQEDYMANMWQTQATANANTLLTAQLKNESDMNSAYASIVKQNGRGMKDLAAG